MDWQDIGSAPKDGKQVLLSGRDTSNRPYRVIGRWVHTSWLWGQPDAGLYMQEPTHWMPLRAPPGSDPTPAAAEARATKATVGRERADEIVDAFSDWMYSSAATNNHGWEWLRQQIAELSLPPPEAKEGAAPSPETGGPDLVPLDVFNEAERTHMAMVWETAAKASPEKGWRLVPVEPTEEMILAASETPQGKALNGAISVAANHGITFNLGSTPQTSAAAEAYRAMLAAAPAAPSPDLAALEELAGRIDGMFHNSPIYVTALRSAILHLKAQPNAGPSADGGMTR